MKFVRECALKIVESEELKKKFKMVTKWFDNKSTKKDNNNNECKSVEGKFGSGLYSYR